MLRRAKAMKSSVLRLLLLLPASPSSVGSLSIPFLRRRKYDYDLVVVGAGASGMFAAGTASSVGFRTLLVERAHVVAVGGGGGGAGAGAGNRDGAVEFSVGGDCTNSACVPSKSVRSIARMAASARGSSEQETRAGRRWLRLAREQADYAVGRVRAREDPARIGDAPNLDLEFVRDCRFVSPHEMRLECYDNSTWLSSGEDGRGNAPADSTTTERIISSRKFIIATGASPIIPEELARAARDAGVPYFTYRSLLRPPPDDGLASTLVDEDSRDIVIVGGGPSACELGHSLTRLVGSNATVSIVAPTLLPSEDVSLQRSAIKFLSDDGCRLHLGSRAVDIVRTDAGARLLMDDGSSIPVDCAVFCTGRSPGPSLKALRLDEAGIDWTEGGGVTVNSYLRSRSAWHVYACGDCASAVRPGDRRAIHAGWTGFNAARNALLPRFLRSTGTHPFVPRVTYLDPEIASAGLSASECIRRYGVDGYDSLRASEEGTDRADMESSERDARANFVELRAEKISGRILGVSACGPAAAEVCNECCLALVKGLTVRDIARTLHSYPSHG